MYTKMIWQMMHTGPRSHVAVAHQALRRRLLVQEWVSLGVRDVVPHVPYTLR